MNTRLSQDAADTLAAHDLRQKFRAYVLARWAKANPPPVNGCVWFPPPKEQELAERAQQIAAGELPF